MATVYTVAGRWFVMDTAQVHGAAGNPCERPTARVGTLQAGITWQFDGHEALELPEHVLECGLAGRYAAAVFIEHAAAE